MSISIEHGATGLTEADRRIASNLASMNGVIRLQRGAIGESRRTFSSEQVCMLLDDISARLEVTARLHKSAALSENGSGINLGNFLREISEMMRETFAPQGKMELTFDNSATGNIDPRDALNAALIAAELLTNACKYAHPTGLISKVHIRSETKDDGSFVVEVTDDGVGFPENFDPSTDEGLGFQFMRALANGLNAQLQFEHDSLGVRARLARIGPEHRRLPR